MTLFLALFLILVLAGLSSGPVGVALAGVLVLGVVFGALVGWYGSTFVR